MVILVIVIATVFNQPDLDYLLGQWSKALDLNKTHWQVQVLGPLESPSFLRHGIHGVWSIPYGDSEYWCSNPQKRATNHPGTSRKIKHARQQILVK